MKRIKTFTFLLLVAVMPALSGCKKEAGPAGPTGAAGNANVKSTNVTIAAWGYTDPSWVVILPFTGITQAILDHGAVLVYVKSGEEYSQLPLTIYQSNSYSTSIETVSQLNQVTVYWTDSDLTQPNNPGPKTFKIVAIASSGMTEHPDVDYTNYEEVATTFNIAE